MSYYPIFLDLSGRKVVVVGGGAVARRKIEALLECGAVVHVIARDLSPELQDRLKNGNIRLESGEFNENSIKDAFIVIAATNDRVLNKEVSETAKKRNILVNVVDQPDECSFIVPSVVKRGGLLIAVSTSGKSPALAKKIRKSLSDQFGEEYGFFLNMMAAIRKQLLTEDIPEDKRSRIFHELVDSSILESIRIGDLPSIAEELERIFGRVFTPDDVMAYMEEG